MGDRNKRERVEDETLEYTERRRSTRIIALEEKKREEKEKKKALELERKKNAEARSKDKGKAKIIEVYELSDDSSDEEQGGPNLHGCRGEALQLSMEEHNGSSSRTDVAVSSIPEIIQTIIEDLQGDDPNMLFAAPANLDVVEHRNNIVKQPMDFASILARMYEGYYTTLDLFKRDVFLMCSNAVFTNPPNSNRHKVAKHMFAHARTIFSGINAELEQCDLELSLNINETPVRKQQDSQRRTSRIARAPPKSAGKNKAAVSEAENRDTYFTLSSNPSILTESQHLNNPAMLQLTRVPGNYGQSLMKFVEDLGPTVQRFAARKLLGTEFQQLPPNPNTIDSSAAASSSLNNRQPNLVLDNSTQQNRYGNYWHACSAAFLANTFFNNANDGGRNNSNSGTGAGAGIGGSSTPIPFKEGTSRHHEMHLGNPRNASTLVSPRVMIPGSESGEGSSSGSRRQPPLFPPQQGYRPNFISLSDLSLQNQTRPTAQSNLNGSFSLPQQMMTNSNVLRNNYNNHLNLNIARQQHALMPQQAANFAYEPNTSMYSLSTPCKPGNFQALLPSPLGQNNGSPYQMQPNQNQFMHQVAPYTTPPTTQTIHPNQTPPHPQNLMPFSTSQMNQVPSRVMNLQTPPHLQQLRPTSTNQMNQVPSQANLQAPSDAQPPSRQFSASALIGGAGTSHDEDVDAVQFTWDVEDPANLNLGL